jgi:hypothetical protein
LLRYRTAARADAIAQAFLPVFFFFEKNAMARLTRNTG